MPLDNSKAVKQQRCRPQAFGLLCLHCHAAIVLHFAMQRLASLPELPE